MLCLRMPLLLLSSAFLWPQLLFVVEKYNSLPVWLTCAAACVSGLVGAFVEGCCCAVPARLPLAQAR
jgi:hypothetical protein